MVEDGEAEDLLSVHGLPLLPPDLAPRGAPSGRRARRDHARRRRRRVVPVRAHLRRRASSSPCWTISPQLSEPVAAAPAESTLATELRALAEADRLRLLTDIVRREAAAVLGHASADTLAADRPFKDLGFDSLTAVELRNRLSSATGLRLPSTLVFDHPAPAVVARWLLGEILGDTDAPVTETSVAAPDDDLIVIVGMACRYPGGVRSPEDLWDLVADGRDAVGPFPADRGWDVDALADGRSHTLEGGFLYDAADFDAAFFGISPREALAMDPQQRLLLEVVVEALERAGIDPHSLKGTRTGVFAGTNSQDYGNLLVDAAEDVAGYVAIGNTASVMSGRVSYTFGLEGPAGHGRHGVFVVAGRPAPGGSVAQAGRMRHGAGQWRGRHVDARPVRGVLPPAGHGHGRPLQGVRRRGRRDRLGRGRRCPGWSSVFPTRRLGGIGFSRWSRGSAVNQDGASNGLTAPNGPSQQRVIRQALASGGLRAVDVDVVEAHGTGTRLGDPIEAQALLATYGQDRETPLLLGFDQVEHRPHAGGGRGRRDHQDDRVDASRHRPQDLHLDEPSPHVDWTSGAIDLVTAHAPGRRRKAPAERGVSSFGISGTNAHTIIEEWREQPVDQPVVPVAASGGDSAGQPTVVGRRVGRDTRSLPWRGRAGELSVSVAGPGGEAGRVAYRPADRVGRRRRVVSRWCRGFCRPRMMPRCGLRLRLWPGWLVVFVRWMSGSRCRCGRRWSGVPWWSGGPSRTSWRGCRL